MDKNTAGLIELIEETDLKNSPDLIREAKIAFLDYVAALMASRRMPKIQRLKKWATANDNP